MLKKVYFSASVLILKKPGNYLIKFDSYKCCEREDIAKVK